MKPAKMPIRTAARTLIPRQEKRATDLAGEATARTKNRGMTATDFSDRVEREREREKKRESERARERERERERE